jgi:hypothetical protein
MNRPLLYESCTSAVHNVLSASFIWPWSLMHQYGTVSRIIPRNIEHTRLYHQPSCAPRLWIYSIAPPIPSVESTNRAKSSHCPPPAATPHQPLLRIKQPFHVNRQHVFMNAALLPILWAHSWQVSAAVCTADCDWKVSWILRWRHLFVNRVTSICGKWLKLISVLVESWNILIEITKKMRPCSRIYYSNVS